jgi:hypothetical protein
MGRLLYGRLEVVCQQACSLQGSSASIVLQFRQLYISWGLGEPQRPQWELSYEHESYRNV